MTFCTVHTHSVLCDGKDTLSDMAAAAFAAGAVSFGASGHSPTPIPHDIGCVLSDDWTEYRTEVLRLREEYDGRMDVLLGVEWDSQAVGDPPAWLDYWIGSVHNLHDPKTGWYYPVDWGTEKLLACRNALFGGNIWETVRGYYQEVSKMAARRPSILGHIDLITKYNEKGALFDEGDPRYRAASLEALHATDPKATVLEINTGAMARGYRTVPYPALFLLREWKAMGGGVILTADAHTTAGIVYGYAQAAELARSAGFQEHLILTRRGFVPCPL